MIPFRAELTSVNMTWRYSPNSEIVTVVIHDVPSDFPDGAKVKCKCGKRMADSKHHPHINENKIEIKVSYLESAYFVNFYSNSSKWLKTLESTLGNKKCVLEMQRG